MSKFQALSGWYNLEYPEEWQFEIDREGRYNFYNPNMGIGVLNIASYFAQDDSQIIHKELKENCNGGPLDDKGHELVYFTSESNDKMFDLHFWITENDNIKIFCTYTVDKFMLDQDKAEQELTEVGQILKSIEFTD